MSLLSSLNASGTAFTRFRSAAQLTNRELDRIQKSANQTAGQLGKIRNSAATAGGSFKNVNTPAIQTAKQLDGVQKSAQRAGQSVGGIKSAAAGAQGGMLQVKNQADQAEKAVGKAARSADTLKGSFDGVKGSAAPMEGGLKNVKNQADEVEKSVGRAGKSAGAGGGLFQSLTGGLFAAEGGQKALNTAMKASAFGLLLTILAPLIEKFDLVGKTSDAVTKAVVKSFEFVRDNGMPIMKAIANMVTLWPRTGVKALNYMIDALNRIHVKVPDWVPGIGGKKFGIDIPKVPEIPELAEGGIIQATPGGKLAIIGEGGKDEAVIPLDRLDAMLGRSGGDRALMLELLEAVRNLAAQPVVVSVDGQTLARATRLGERQLARR